MEKEEFIKRLKENKFFEDIDEMIEYKLPVVQYFLTNHSNVQLQNNSRVILSNNITIKYNKETDFPLINQAFESIRARVKFE